ncbi:hypothetical protein ACOME3_007878 [Neoechinorhynchus agilis]
MLITGGIDDDIYIKNDQLENFLRSIDNKKAYYIGQPGTGIKGEVGRIGLGRNENFCMGGPGIIMSRETLRKIAPYIHLCLNDLRSHHEDVEVGRCIRRFANVSCTWNYEMLHILYNHPSGTKGYNGFLRTRDILHISQTEFYIGDGQLLPKAHKSNSSPRWTTFSAGSQYSLQSPEQPVRRTLQSYQLSFEALSNDFMYRINKRERELGRTVKFNKFLKAHNRYFCSVGFITIMDLQIVVGRYRGSKSTKVMNKRLNVLVPVSNVSFIAASAMPVAKINFIVPAQGRQENLMRLMDNFMRIMRKDQASLTIVAPSAEHYNSQIHGHLIKAKRNGFDIRVIRTGFPFNRGKYRSIGAQSFTSDQLLFFIDLDMVFDARLLLKIRLSTIRNRQAYVPIVYSEYDPDTWSNWINTTDQFEIAEDRGYWRVYGFGMLGIYKADLDRIGGWEMNISGWGKEDVIIYEKIISNGIDVFRPIEPSLIHVFHGKDCPSSLPKDQLKMCRGTQLLASRSEASLLGASLKNFETYGKIRYGIGNNNIFCVKNKFM